MEIAFKINKVFLISSCRLMAISGRLDKTGCARHLSGTSLRSNITCTSHNFCPTVQFQVARDSQRKFIVDCIVASDSPNRFWTWTCWSSEQVGDLQTEYRQDECSLTVPLTQKSCSTSLLPE